MNQNLYFLGHTVSHSGNIVYSEIRGFMKKQHTGIVMYKTLTTSKNKTIQLSGDHLIYARKTSLNKYHPM